MPGCDRAPLRLYRAERRADAVLRQSRRLCRRRHDGRHLGDGRLLRADRQERATSRAASASAACSSRCRPARSSSRTIASSARARKWSRASSCARARCSRWASSSAPRPRSSTATTGEVHMGEVPPYSVVVSGHAARQAAAERRAGASALLRGDRQARRRADPLQDQHQRAAARLKVCADGTFTAVETIDSSVCCIVRGRQWVGTSALQLRWPREPSHVWSRVDRL